MAAGFIEALVSQVGQGAAQTVSDSIFGDTRRQKQLDQQAELTKMQGQANKELSKYGHELNKQMWDYTNYENQVKHLKAAGLNPALLYGMGGAGGATVGTGATTSGGGGHAASEADMMSAAAQQGGMGIQAGLAKAQERVLNAQADKLEADANKTKGVDTEAVKMSIEDIAQTVENKKIQRLGMILQNDYDKMRNFIRQSTGADEILHIEYNRRQAFETLLQLENSTEISISTKEDLIEAARLQNNLLSIEIAAKKAGISLTEAQAESVHETISQKWEELKVQWKNADSNERNTIANEEANRIKEQNPGIGNLTGSILRDALMNIEQWDNKYEKKRKY